MTLTTSVPSIPTPAIKVEGYGLRRVTFIKEFIRAPKVMAAVAPSSKALARKMVEGLDLAGARAVVEYGPGLGTFTDAILAGMGESAAPGAGPGREAGAGGGEPRFIAIERNARMAELFAQRHPGVTLRHDDAANVQQIIREQGLESVDYVLSGLGWPSFTDEVRTRILEATAQVLRPGGEFRTFGYHVGLLMRGAWHFRRTVRRLFSEVTISEVVWGNVPPAFVYRCKK